MKVQTDTDVMPDYLMIMFCWHAAAQEGIVAKAFPG